MCTSVYISCIYNKQNLKRTQTSSSRWMDKQTVYIHIVELYPAIKGNKLLTPATTWMTLKGIMPRGKKPASRGYILYDSIYIVFSRDEFIGMKNRSDSGCQGLWLEGGCDSKGGIWREVLFCLHNGTV